MMLFRTEKNDDMVQGRKVPLVLFVTQILLVMIAVRYGLNFCFISFPDDVPLYRLVLNTAFVIFYVSMAVLTANAMLGLTSANLKSWRQAVRSAVILTIMSAFYEILEYFGIYSASVNFNLWFAAVLTASTLLIMFLPSVRKFYMPPMMEVPPAKEWVKYVIATPLVSSKGYRFSYDDDSVQIADVLEPDAGSDI